MPCASRRRFIIEEEKHLVLTTGVGWTAFTKVWQVEWTTDAAAKLVARKLRSCDSASIVEKAVGGGRCSAIVLAERTMKLIRTALGDELDLTAAAATFRCGRIRGYRAKFLNRVDRRVAGCCKRLARGLIVRINSVNSDVALVRTRTGHRADAIGGSSADVVADNTGLQADQ